MEKEIFELKVKIKEYEKLAQRNERLLKKEQILYEKHTDPDLRTQHQIDMNSYKSAVIKYRMMATRIRQLTLRIEEYAMKKKIGKHLSKIIKKMSDCFDENAFDKLERELDDFEIQTQVKIGDDSFTSHNIVDGDLDKIARGML
ncbi:hypothetical protein TCON_1086 [Astathelohania contejeani]|uniref:Uncharacterized protein n=1 Tax=Astathelohania contejeani TaxID=164912 RepID=A0ABQ7HZY6_9MICR|nr:hypothetical protein TCON_1086 [Thelohania contejeani]